MKVKVIRKGYYANLIRREGEQIELEEKEHFSDKWMMSPSAKVEEKDEVVSKKKKSFKKKDEKKDDDVI